MQKIKSSYCFLCRFRTIFYYQVYILRMYFLFAPNSSPPFLGSLGPNEWVHSYFYHIESSWSGSSILLKLINIKKIVNRDILNRFHRFSSSKIFYDGSILLFLSWSLKFVPPVVQLERKSFSENDYFWKNDFKEGCSCVANEKLRKSCETSVNTLFLNPCMTKRPSSNSVSKII